MKSVRLVAVAALAFGSVLVSGTAATAGGSGSVTIGGGTLFGGCQDVPYSYAVTIPAEAVDWDLDVTVINPDGDEVTGDVVVDAPATGVSAFELCGDYDLAGEYTAESLLTWYTETDEFTTDLAPVDFTMAAANTTTELKVNAPKGSSSSVTATVLSRIQSPSGTEPFSDASVSLELQKGSRWVSLDDDDTNASGRATLKARLSGSGPWTLRAVTEEGDASAESMSKTVKVSLR